MAVSPLIESLNSGELSPRMEARVGFQRYPNAAKMLRNCILFPQGGFTRRPGTRYVAAVKNADDETILLPIQYSETDSYMGEMGDEYIRFFRRQGRIDVADTDAAITNGTFTSNINDWDDRSTSGAFASREDSENTEAGLSTSAVLDLPANIASGDLLLLFITLRHPTSARTITTPTGWTNLYNVVGSGDLRRAACYYKVADGGEGATVTVTASAASDWVSVSYRVTGYTGTPESNTASGSSATPNPPSLTPSWGQDKTLWFASCHHIGGSGVTDIPDGFGNTVKRTDFGDFNNITVSELKQEATTKDPATFAIASNDWVAGTVAVQPSSTTIQHNATNGRLKLAATSGGTTCAEQDVAVTATYQSNVHVLQFDIDGYGMGVVGLKIGSTSEGDEILSEIELGPGKHAIEFTPGTTTFYIQFCNATEQTMYVDNVVLLDDAALEVLSPYDEADLPGLRYYQNGSNVYLLHGSYGPRKLIRRGHRSWSLQEAFFQDGPYGAINAGFDFDQYQLHHNPLFINGLDEWDDDSTGDGFVEHNDESYLAELDPGDTGTAILRTDVITLISKVHTVHVLIAGSGPVDFSIGTTEGGSEYLSEELVPGWHSFSFTSSATTTDLHFEFSYDENDKARAGVGACLIYREDARLFQPSGVSGEVTVDAVGFTPFASTDVGRLIRLTWPGHEPGYGVITSYVSTSQVVVQVIREFGDTTPTEDWRLGAWGGTNGYPQTMGSFDGRLILAYTTGQPKTLWATQSDDDDNMRPDSFIDGAITVEDDDALALTLDSETIDPVFWMNGKRQLIVGTAGGQWVVDSVGPVLTPTDRGARLHSAVPASRVQRAAINEITLFADSSQREVHDIGFKFEDDGFVATDLTILADHVFRSKNVQMAYQRRPYSTVWSRRADGRLAALAYNRQHDVLGWTQSIIGGSFDGGDAVVGSIGVIPGAEDSNQQYDSDERDELWMIVKRTVNGSTVKYIEFMEYFFDGPLREDYDTEKLWRDAMVAAQADAFHVDSGLTYSGTAATTITGLSHLEGEAVKVWADGKSIPNMTVSGGQITLPAAASKVHVGLAYKWRWESLKLAVGAQAGTSVTKIKAITSIAVVVLDTGTFKATTVAYDETSGRRQHDLYTFNFRRDRDEVGQAIPLHTGETSFSPESSYTGDARIYAESDEPVPFTLLGVAPIMDTQDAALPRR